MFGYESYADQLATLDEVLGQRTSESLGQDILDSNRDAHPEMLRGMLKTHAARGLFHESTRSGGR
jgi:hypothetical protein